VRDDWHPFLEIWGAFEPIGSREFPIQQKRYEQTTARFRTRYRTDIDPALHRIVYGGKSWNVRSPIDVLGRHIEIVIEASEVQ